MKANEAIKHLQQLYPNGGHCWLDEQRIEAIGMAVKALQEEPVELKEVYSMIHTIIAECCDWLAMNTNLSHDEIEDCRNLMLTVKEEQFKAQKGE